MDKAMRDSFRQFSRNERWGTCGACPRDSEGSAYPEFCKCTDRYDHQLTIEQLRDAYEMGMKDHQKASY